jgi:1-acyl-sn-glycerol-3-phosphate acyltransferase
MIKFFSQLKHVPSDRLLYRALPHLAGELARRYFRMEIEGAENIPSRGPALICPNHSGYSGLDALLLHHEIQRASKRVPRVLTHRFWFLNEWTSVPAEKVGLIEATTENGLHQLKKNNLVVIFPEGERGNFKPSAQRYRLKEFRRGFIRMALIRECPIVPTVILGAEETHINLAQLRLDNLVPGLRLPVPLNILPLPAKWRIRFLPRIDLPYRGDAIRDSDLMNEIAQEIRERMQDAINEELRKRGSAF